MIRLAAIAIVAAAAAGCATAPSPASRDASAALAVNRQILLTVRQPNSVATGLVGAPTNRYLRRRGYGPTPSVERTLNQLAREYGVRRLDGWPMPSLDLYCEILEVPAGMTVEDAIARLSEDPRVDLVQRMNLFETLASSYDDPLVDLQSAVLELGVEQAHRLATGKDVLVAVVDSAVDSSHPDLRGRVSITRNLVDSRAPRGGEIHGTAVAGVIASAVNNAEGIVGVAPDVEIAALRACWPVGGDSGSARCSSFSLARALEAALSLDANVINLSLAGPFDPLLSRLLDAAIERGIAIVAADPDRSSQAAGFPTSHSQVIAVRSTAASTDEPSRYLLAAPASEILTTTPHAGYGFLSGNSLAAAHVSGVIALLMERVPAMPIDQIATVLADTTIHTGSAESINACRALERVANRQVCD